MIGGSKMGRARRPFTFQSESMYGGGGKEVKKVTRESPVHDSFLKDAWGQNAVRGLLQISFPLCRRGTRGGLIQGGASMKNGAFPLKE